MWPWLESAAILPFRSGAGLSLVHFCLCEWLWIESGACLPCRSGCGSSLAHFCLCEVAVVSVLRISAFAKWLWLQSGAHSAPWRPSICTKLKPHKYFTRTLFECLPGSRSEQSRTFSFHGGFKLSLRRMCTGLEPGINNQSLLPPPRGTSRCTKLKPQQPSPLPSSAPHWNA